MTVIAPFPRTRRPRLPKPPEPQEERVVLYGVSWDTYCALRDELDQADDRHVHLTYDEGALEIFVPSTRHEKSKKLLARMVELVSLERDIPISSFGSTTWRTKRRRKGAEPDECYYIQNELKVRGKADLDLRRDPPPDLVIEIDITTSTVPKQPIYAALGVAEVWRFDGARLQSLRRAAQGDYVPHDTSLAFPFLKMTDVERFVRRWPKTDETSVLRAWRDWLRRPNRRGNKEVE